MGRRLAVIARCDCGRDERFETMSSRKSNKGDCIGFESLELKCSGCGKRGAFSRKALL